MVWILSAAVGGILLLLLFASIYMYRFAVVRHKDAVNYWEHPEALKRFADVPDDHQAEIEKDRVFMVERSEKVYMTSRDGLKLCGRMIEHPSPRGIVFMCHGYRSHPMIDFAGAVSWMYGHGMSLFIVDHRASGNSEGKYITFGVRESQDLEDWCRFLEKRYPSLPVVFDGISMGAFTVLLASGGDLPENVRGIIADCGYTSPADICKKVLKQWFHLPPFPIYYTAMAFVKLRTGVWLPGYDARRALEKNKLPILFAHGTADDFVPFWMSPENRKHCLHCETEMVTAEGAKHGYSYVVAKKVYQEEILRLWKKAGILPAEYGTEVGIT